MDCIICNLPLGEAEETVIVKKKDLETLIKFSELRNDKLLNVFKNVDEISLHTNCRKRYTKENVKGVYKPLFKRNISAASSDGAAAAGPSGLNFPFKHKCFICAQELSDDENNLNKENRKPIQKRRLSYQVGSEKTKETIVQALQVNQQSNVNQVILQRIEHVDLVHSQARYHKECYSRILLPKQNLKRGRPECTDVTSAMQIIYDFIDQNDDTQFSVLELKNLLTDMYTPDDRTILKRLREKYEGRILVTNLPGKSPIVTFRDFADNILIQNWYNQKKENDKEERLRIIKKAAQIIREDVCLKTYERDVYPCSSDFLKNAQEDVPESLNLFLNTLAGTRLKSEHIKRKLLSIAHAIIYLLRPKKFLSSILLALSVSLKKNFGSKMLINILNRLGFCASYTETNTFEISAINVDDFAQDSSGFVQFVFDNADANISTIDGHNTFHAMGGIECKTSMTKSEVEQPTVRMSKIPNAEVLGNFGYVPIQHNNKQKNGLKEIIAKDIDADCKTILPSPTDLIWLFGKQKNIPDIGGWNGFMQTLTEKEPFELTRIKTLPFVNSPPSDYDTLNTVLALACQATAQNNQKITIVTFDQPLYIKSREMVAAASETTPLYKSVVIRIGGFHLLMSYMGGIGYIMAGSGLKELWSTIYAPNTVNHMLTGHAYSRALRANLLTYLVLSGLILNEMILEEDEISEMENILYNVNNGITTEYVKEQKVTDVIKRKFDDCMTKIESKSPTAKLWVQYFKMVCLIKKFIEAERSGNWELHLETVKQMLPIFVASGHFNYAKSLRIYIQDMDCLPEIMPPDEYNKFTAGGFTVRRTDNFWSGTWTDMVIEQSLMRTMKCRGGLTHGRGLTDSVIAKWILSMPTVQKVESCLEAFCDLDDNGDNVHKDSTIARMKKDDSDAANLTKWFEEHPPFIEHSENEIMSLSTGLVGDTKIINCHEAFVQGQKIITQKSGMPFSDLTYSRKERIVPLANINSTTKQQDHSDVSVDPLTIFQRISLLKKGEEEMKEYLKYELAPYPIALFDEIGMRKTKKSALYDLFKTVDNSSVTGKQAHYVIDGGYLLHRVVWNKGQTYEDICVSITEYVKRHYGNKVSVIFDGYEDDTTTKTAERIRRSGYKMTANVNFESHMQLTTSQAEFLSSNNNKTRFISLLSKYLTQSGIRVSQCKADADTTIVTEALSLSHSDDHDIVIIVGEDMDLLVLLTALTPDENKNVLFLKPARGEMESKMYNANSLKFDKLKNHLLLLHAFSGCDTTSALYNFNFGKKKFFDVLTKNEKLRDLLQIFNQKDADKDAVVKAGEKLFICLYGGDLNGDLNELRHQKFARSLTKSKFNLANLPPTNSAAKQHSLRVYHQVQMWLGNNLNPFEYGWQLHDNILTPVTCLMKPAPDNVLKMIFCRCKTNCGVQCGCRKSGLNCSDVCENCKGQSCTNARIIFNDSDDDDEIFDINDCNADLISKTPSVAIQNKKIKL